jgi:sucrose-6-phosphate hydrolase SacC (GH32 family)
MAIVFLTAQMGQSQSGLSTVGFTVKLANGSVFAARTTNNVVDFGFGNYGVELGLPDNGRYLVVWDTGIQNPRYAFNAVDTYPESQPAVQIEDVKTMVRDVLQEVQGLKEKNIKKTADNPANPTLINVSVKKDSAPNWSPENLQEQYSINIITNGVSEVEQYGG